MTLWDNMYYFVHDRVYEDFTTLTVNQPDEFHITETTRTASVPPGKRKIAMSIRQQEEYSDYHFYFRHSDGTWSHKMGLYPVSNLSIVTQVPITDANILTTSAEYGYDDGTRYYLIDKSAVVDFPHFYGQDDDTLYTPIDFRDKAGDSLTKSFTIQNSWNSRFDYPGDKDFFRFTPTESGFYGIGVPYAEPGWDVDGAVYVSDGNVWHQDYSSGNYWYGFYLYAGNTYFMHMEEKNQNTGYYVMYCWKYW
jgi:hypothetical protein